MRKGKKELKTYEWGLYRFHCEFVRRNPLYAKQYREWKKSRRDGKYGLSLLAKEWKLVSHEDLPDPAARPNPELLKSLVASENLRTPMDEEIDKFVDRALTDRSTTTHLAISQVPKSSAGLMFLMYLPEHDPEKFERTAINMRLSKHAIMESLEFFVDRWIKERAVMGLKQRSSRRVHFGAWVDFLKVYDMKTSGKSFKLIGDEVWKGNRGNLEIRARNGFTKAQKLVQSPPLLGKLSIG